MWKVQLSSSFSFSHRFLFVNRWRSHSASVHILSYTRTFSTLTRLNDMHAASYSKNGRCDSPNSICGSNHSRHSSVYTMSATWRLRSHPICVSVMSRLHPELSRVSSSLKCWLSYLISVTVYYSYISSQRLRIDIRIVKQFFIAWISVLSRQVAERALSLTESKTAVTAFFNRS